MTVTASLFQNNRVYGGQGGNGGAGSPSYGGSDWYYSGFPGGSGGNGGLGYGGSIYNGSAAHLSSIANIFSQDGVTGGEGGNAGSNVGTGTGGGGNGGTAYGGALYNDSGNAEAINVALYASYVGGGPPGYGNPSGSYGYGYGGGIYNSGMMLVVNSTVARNYIPNYGAGGGSSNSGTLTFKNSIVAQNSQGNCLGGATSGGYNLEDGNTCGFTQPGDLSNTDPLFVAPVSGNLRLQLTSPAIDAGNNAAVPAGVTTDLDGNPRFVDIPAVPDTGNGTPPIVDMGAYEAQVVDVALGKAVAPPTAVPGQVVIFTLTLSNTGSLPASGIVVTDTLPVVLSGLSFTSTLAVTDTGHIPPYVWTVQDLAAGQGCVITVSGVLTLPLAAGVYTNTAVIAATDDLLAENNTAVVTFTVPNVAPVFTSAPVVTATQDVPYTYTAAAADDNGDTLTVTAPALPAWLTLTDHGDGTAALSGTPSNADVGNHPVVLRVTDSGGLSDTQSFTITVANVNDAPAFTSTLPLTATQDAPYTYTVAATDPDLPYGDALTITAPTLPAWLTLTDHGDGTATLSGTPSNADVGAHPVVLRVTDSGGLTDTQSFTVTVANVNDAPAFTSAPVTAATQDMPYTYAITTTDPDLPHGDALTITAPTLPAWLTLTDHGDGTASLSGTPGSAQVGNHSVVLRVTDRAGAFAEQSFTITVAEMPRYFIFLPLVLRNTP